MLTFITVICLLAAIDAAPNKLTPISMPALGRQFSLGVLYDRRKERILTGPKLWTEEELGNHDTVPSYSTRFEIVASADISENLKHFDLSASLKMSFLSGMVDVAGSAGYLDDRKTRNRIARVSLGYKSSTFKKTLAPELFLKITYPEVLKTTPDATDVVVAIQYGAGAIFTFDRELEEYEKMRDIQGRLSLSVKQMPSFSVSVNGTGALNLTETKRKEFEKFSCHFHGDFILKKHPGTYEEAIEVYKELPGLLGENYEHSVPVRVWLYPIEDLPVDRAQQLVYDIKESLVTSVTDVINDLDELQRDCNDILYSSKVSLRHSCIREKVKTFNQYIERYMLNFKQQITKILPAIRKGELPVSELTKLVAQKERSPFNKDKLEEWLAYYKEEVKVLNHIQSLPNYCKNEGDFSSKLLNDVRFTVGLTLSLGTMEDHYLSVLEKYLTSQEIRYDVNTGRKKKWFSPGSEVLSDLYVLSSTFKDFYERTKKEKGERLFLENDIQFLVREKIIEDAQTKKGVTIELYDQAMLVDANYQLTSPSGKPKFVLKTDESITLAWGEPSKGKELVKNYKVNVYIAKKDGGAKSCKEDVCKLYSISTTGTQFMLIGLKADASYFFTVSAFTQLGEASVSVMSDEIVTKKCAPGTYHVSKHECKPCASGTFSSVEGLTKCDLCPTGTFNPSYGSKESKECTACPAGTYNTKEGSQIVDDCTPCPTGTFSSIVASDHKESCLKCPSGTYGNVVGLAACIECEKSTYNPKIGKVSCLKCPSGTHTDSTGDVSVTECIGVDAITLAKMKISEVKGDLEKSTKELASMRNVNDAKLTKALGELGPKKQALRHDIDTEVKAVVNEMNLVHDCKWTSGEGSSLKSRITVAGVTSREECIYKCLRIRRNNPYVNINGVTRKLSTKACMCVENLVRAESRRYEYCMI